MIGVESELLIKTGLIMKRRVMKKKAMRENVFGKKVNGAEDV